MLPDYKEMAIISLMGEFIRLMSYQTGKTLFDESGTLVLDSGMTPPVYLSTGAIIDIARLLKDIRHPVAWRYRDVLKVYELAAAAEQCENDDSDHLMHVMLSLKYYCPTHDSGQLQSVRDDEKDTFTVFFTDDLTGAPLEDLFAQATVLEENDTITSYTLKEVTLHYVEEDSNWKLTFKAKRGEDGAEEELTGDTFCSGFKKEIADWMIDKARKKPDDE